MAWFDRPSHAVRMEAPAHAGNRTRNHAHELANATVRELVRQESPGRDGHTERLLLRHTTPELRLRGEKCLERLRA
jgi:hypothetical protein